MAKQTWALIVVLSELVIIGYGIYSIFKHDVFNLALCGFLLGWKGVSYHYRNKSK